MKSSSKIKSPECLLKTTRKGNILKHMTSTTTKRPATQTYQDSFLDTTKVVSISHEDISGIVPLESCDSKSSLLDLTPKIIISSCSNKERDLNQDKGRQKTVARKKIKSPVCKQFSQFYSYKLIKHPIFGEFCEECQFCFISPCLGTKIPLPEFVLLRF